MKSAIAMGGIAFAAAATAVAIPSAGSASVDHPARVTVPVTVIGHIRHMAYKIRPRSVQELEPYSRDVHSIRWSAWSGTSARGRGTMSDIGQRGGGAPCWVVLSRVRSGHFTHLRATTYSPTNSPMYFHWAGSAKLWKNGR